MIFVKYETFKERHLLLLVLAPFNIPLLGTNLEQTQSRERQITFTCREADGVFRNHFVPGCI